MGLEQLEITTGLNKVDFAIKLLREWEPTEGYYLADSGGKDSCVVRDILVKSGCKFDAHYNVSPIDPPQIYSFLKEHHPDTQWDYHARGFWKMVQKNGLPLPNRRWCCRIIKESGGFGRMVVTGIRSDESNNRNKYNYIRSYVKSKIESKVMISPILQFSRYDVWQYIRENNIDYCSLYDEGFERLGCVLCPFLSKKNIERDEKYFPKIANLWKLACEHIVQQEIANNYLTKRGKPLKYQFKTGQERYDWWVGRR
jgi:phosphoadenosine phosphosulfate reductase